MVRAIALSIALLFGLGMIIPIATEYAEAGPKKVTKHKKKRHWKGVKKYSKRWWQLYNAQEKRKKKSRSARRSLRLRQMRLAKVREAQIAKGMRDAQNWARAHGVHLPGMPVYAENETSPETPATETAAVETGSPSAVQTSVPMQEVSYNVENDRGTVLGAASISVVGTAVEDDNYNRRIKTIGGVPTSSLRREVINQMIRENGWVVNDYQKVISGTAVYVVVAQTPGPNGRVRSRLFYFTESNGRIYNVATNSNATTTEEIAAESEKMIAAIQRSPRRLQQARK
jgi:hypothetical protein